MAAPAYSISQIPYKNPHASLPLHLTLIVVRNTSDEELARNITENSRLPLEWIAMQDAHDGVAVLVGGGPSAAYCIPDIRDAQKAGATVFAMNAASVWLRANGIKPDYQVIADAKEETATLVDPDGICLIASQANPATFKAAESRVKLWHLDAGDIEPFFPEERVRKGGYAIVGGGASVGNSALCLAYAMGFRELHCFGYDSSHRGDKSHAYPQPMNQFIPCSEVEWAGTKYVVSVAMKAQAEKFQITARAIQEAGAKVVVHGDGLLPAMWNTPPQDRTERDKYRIMWQFDSYREFAPGEEIIDEFLAAAKPQGRIIDFGCGTGRAGLELSKLGYDVLLVDFADNCRDNEALTLPFLEWDLTQPLTVSGDCGLCTDVMEHIPAEDVDTVIRNIMASVGRCYFQISTIPDKAGGLIGSKLHLSIHDAEWWFDLFDRLGFTVTFADADDRNVRFLATSQTGQVND